MARTAAKRSTKDEFAQAFDRCLGLFGIAALFSGAINLLYLSSPLYLTQVYNRVLSSGSIPTLVGLTLALMIALAAMAALEAVRARLLIRAAARLDRQLSERVFQAIVDRAVRQGPLARNAQALRDLDHFRSVIAGPAMHFLFDAPWCPLFLVVLVLIDPLLGLIGTLGAVLLFGLAVLNDAVTRRGLSASTEAATESYAFTESVVRYAEPVRAMGMLPQLGDRWREARLVMMSRQGGASDRNGDLGALIRFCRLMLQGLMLGMGAALAIRGSILPATIFAASVVMGRALAPVEQAVTAWRQIVSALEAARKVQAALNDAPPERRRTRVPAADGGLKLTGLGYAPPGAAQATLEGVELVVEPGEAVAILGVSGAGKSTLARLITGATPPTSGALEIGGVPAERWTRQGLARHVGYLPQEVGLFPGTVRENIARFQNARDREVIAAARRAGVHELILSLPDGYETGLGEAGAGLSGGQRQRIGLARAIFGPPRLLVLDEPNAHLDQAGEAALARALRELKSKGVTVIVITHRPAALELADRIVVLAGGRVAADGPRTEVLARLQDGRTMAAA